MVDAPRLPGAMLLRYTDVPEGRIRTRVLGEPRDGRPPVVVVQGMAVSDYLLPPGAWALPLKELADRATGGGA